MTVVEDFYDHLHFTDCFLASPVITGQQVVVTARELGLMPGHPLNPGTSMVTLPVARLVFLGVVRSERTIHEYWEDPVQSGFKAKRSVTDGPFQEGGISPVEEFWLEGELQEPHGWVDWSIQASSFRLEVPSG